MQTPVVVELWYDDQWNDITSDVFDENAEQPIRIVRGRGRETERIASTMCTLSISNADGKYSPHNALSPLYGKIRLNTPIRVRTTDPASVRFVGEVEAWPVRWTVDEAKVWVPIRAFGITRRLGAAGSKALARSALRRYIDAESPSAYWALDAGQLSTVAALTAGTGNAVSLSQIRASGFGAYPMAPWLENGVVLDVGSSLACTGVTMDTNPNGYAVDLVFAVSAAQTVITGRGPDPGSGIRWTLTLTAGAFNDAELDIFSDGVNVGYIGIFGLSVNQSNYPVFDGVAHHARVSAEQDGSDIVWTLHLDGENTTDTFGTIFTGAGTPDDSVSTATYTTEDETLTAIDRVTVVQNVTGNDRGRTGISHIVVWDTAPSITDAAAAALGHAGEEAHDRIARIGAEEGITVNVTGNSSATLGPQPIAPPYAVMEEAAAADGGILYETRDAAELDYLCHSARYNPTAVVTLDYAAGGEVAPSLETLPDTQHIRNVVTVTRMNGGSSAVPASAHALLLGAVPHPNDEDVIGRYPADLKLNLESDDQTRQQAGWHLHLGIWDEPRYPSVPIDLSALEVDGKTALVADAVAMDIGDRIVVTNPPVWTGTVTIDQLVQGYTETLWSYRWDIVPNTSPAGPWLVGVIGTGRAATRLSFLQSAINDNTTSISVTSATGNFSAAAVPYDIMIGGERMTVTAVSGSGTQTLTVTRAANGIAKSHNSLTPVTIYQPLRYGR